MWVRSQDKMELVPINSKLYIPISKTGEDFGIFHEEIKKTIRKITIFEMPEK